MEARDLARAIVADDTQVRLIMHRNGRIDVAVDVHIEYNQDKNTYDLVGISSEWVDHVLAQPEHSHTRFRFVCSCGRKGSWVSSVQAAQYGQLHLKANEARP